MYRIIWPEDKRISPDRIRVMYQDAVSNGDCPEGCRNTDAMAKELDHAGLITLARKNAPKVVEESEDDWADREYERVVESQGEWGYL